MNTKTAHWIESFNPKFYYIFIFILLIYSEKPALQEDLATEKGRYSGFEAVVHFCTFLICIKHNLMKIFRSTASFTDYENNDLPHSSKAHLKPYLFLGLGPYLVFPHIILGKDLSMVAWRSSIATEIFSLALIRHPHL